MENHPHGILFAGPIRQSAEFYLRGQFVKARNFRYSRGQFVEARNLIHGANSSKHGIFFAGPMNQSTEFYLRGKLTKARDFIRGPIRQSAEFYSRGQFIEDSCVLNGTDYCYRVQNSLISNRKCKSDRFWIYGVCRYGLENFETFRHKHWRLCVILTGMCVVSGISKCFAIFCSIILQILDCYSDISTKNVIDSLNAFPVHNFWHSYYGSLCSEPSFNSTVTTTVL
jgi:hypothetical protein